MKKVFKFFKRILLIILSFILIYALFVFILSHIGVDQESTGNPTISAYIITNGVHTDIVVPIKNNLMDWSQEIKFSNTESQDTSFKYLAMGWGDKGFYLETPTWAELQPHIAFNAAFGLGTTAIHATFYKEIKVSDSCKLLSLSEDQYQRLVDYISSSFRKDKTSHWMNIKSNANYGKNDAFYEAKGSYSMFHTCNTWANNALKASGQKACVWTVLDTGIFNQYD